MRTNAVIGLKPELDHEELVDLAISVVAPGGRIHLVSLVQVGKEGDEPDRLEATKGQIAEVAKGVREQGFEVDTVVQISSVGLGSELARIATARDADLLVIGLAKRTRVGKALLGSDAQSVLMTATCPVLAHRLT